MSKDFGNFRVLSAILYLCLVNRRRRRSRKYYVMSRTI